jgi:hypothetical protein
MGTKVGVLTLNNKKNLSAFC